MYRGGDVSRAAMLGPMNRQIRREQAKQDKKVQRDKQKKRAARRARVESVRQRRSARRSVATKPAGGAGKQAPRQGRRAPGRFSGALMIATVFFIVLQSAVPVKDATVLNSITGAGFFLLFGYFSELYMERRGAPRGLLMTLITGLLLVVGVGVSRLLQPTLGMDWLMMGLALPGVVGGAYLGRLVFYNTPA